MRKAATILVLASILFAAADAAAQWTSQDNRFVRSWDGTDLATCTNEWTYAHVSSIPFSSANTYCASWQNNYTVGQPCHTHTGSVFRVGCDASSISGYMESGAIYKADIDDIGGVTASDIDTIVVSLVARNANTDTDPAYLQIANFEERTWEQLETIQDGGTWTTYQATIDDGGWFSGRDVSDYIACATGRSDLGDELFCQSESDGGCPAECGEIAVRIHAPIDASVEIDRVDIAVTVPSGTGGSGGWCSACNGDADCQVGWACRARVGYPGSWCAASCADDADCPLDHLCHPTDNRCDPRVDLRCSGGDSWYIDACGNQLSLDDTCGAGEVCRNDEGGRCVTGECLDCKYSDDCPEQWSCYSWTARPDVTWCTPACTTDTDCPSGHMCDGSICVPTLTDRCYAGDPWREDSCGRLLYATDDCTADEVCRDDAGSVCVSGSCLECTSAADCPGGWSCRAWSSNGSITWCSPPCTSDADCTFLGVDHYCSADGSCDPVVSDGCYGGDVWNTDACGRPITLKTTCSSSQSCSEASGTGQCVDDCTDECSGAGTTECINSGTYRTCGDYDSDACLEWDSGTSCASGEACSSGTCSPTGGSGTTCSACGDNSDCASGWVCNWWVDYPSATWCAESCTSDGDCPAGHFCGSNSYCAPEWEQRCYNGDAWLYDACGNQLALAQDCDDATEYCSGGSCIPACTDACTAGSVQCSSGHVLQTCQDVDADGCLEAVFSTCGDGEYCTGGACSPTDGYCDACQDNEDCPVSWACLSYVNHPSKSFCAPACTADSDCRSDHRCAANGTCVPTQAPQCTAGDVYNFDSCGNQLSLLDDCTADEVCSVDACVPSCTDDCATAGSTTCVDGHTVRTCGDFDADSCLDTASAPCADGEYCSSGSCQIRDATCDACQSLTDCPVGWSCRVWTNYPGNTWCGAPCSADSDCETGHFCTSNGYCAPNHNTECIGGDVWRVDNCGNQLELWDDCDDALQVCSGGACVGQCTDDCSPAGSTGCVDSQTAYTCQDTDGDGCLERSLTTCPIGESCASGSCTATCVDECSSAGATGCIDQQTSYTCGDSDGDGCLEQTASACASGELCTNGTCQPDDGTCRSCQSPSDCPSGWDCRYWLANQSVSWCAEPCSADSDCATNHFCGSSGFCAPGWARQCQNGDSWTYDACGNAVELATACTSPTAYCDDSDGLCHECTTDAHCDDGLPCNGPETCSANQCVAGQAPVCDPNATCVDDQGGCVCDTGFSGDGTTCSDVDECALGLDNCGANSVCTNTDGGFDCACAPGYADVGGTCADIDECQTGADNCSDDAVCTNTDGSFSCSCSPGYVGDGIVCADVDECSNGANDCDANALCTNTPGGFTCECADGFDGDGTICTDIDECAAGTDNCAPDATCTNTMGSFACDCDTGFGGDGVTCTDLDECTDGSHRCSANADCANVVGGYVCECHDGFVGDGISCTDVDECADGSNDCSPDATCTNTPGGFECSCNTGFEGDGTTCTKPTDEDDGVLANNAANNSGTGDDTTTGPTATNGQNETTGRPGTEADSPTDVGVEEEGCGCAHPSGTKPAAPLLVFVLAVAGRIRRRRLSAASVLLRASGGG